jgi:F0F1-type ATP synthase membrane subunit c/vacuolar-type H+-ATPase subunit K
VFLAAQLPNLAGLILAAAITTVGIVAVHGIRAAARREPVGDALVVGGLMIAALVGAVGLILVVAGAPAFK